MPLATLLSILISFNATAANHEAQTLSESMPTPSLTVDTWVKGEEVKSFDPEKVYVIEFWATWCGPCLTSIPHLTKIQKEHPDDLVVIGVAASERPDRQPPSGGNSQDPVDPNVIKQNMLAKVQSFTTSQGDQMNYRVAFDFDASMARDWMIAAKQRSIPCAFLVGKGAKLLWVGHPKFIDEPLAKALAQKSPIAKPADEIKPVDNTTHSPTTEPSAPAPPADKKPAS